MLLDECMLFIKTINMRKLYPLSILFLFLISCVPQINYLGASYGTTEQVDVFVSEEAISKPYSIIGKSEVPQFWTSFTSKDAYASIQKQAIEKAKSVGADAILLISYGYITEGKKISNTFQTDSVGKGILSNNTTTVTPIYSGGIAIQYLKYKK